MFAEDLKMRLLLQGVVPVSSRFHVIILPRLEKKLLLVKGAYLGYLNKMIVQIELQQRFGKVSEEELENTTDVVRRLF